MKLLENKTAIVTGGNDGIGKAISIIFASNGANVIIIGRDKQKCLDVVKEMNLIKISQDQKFEFYLIDVSKYDDVKKCFEQIILDYNKIDILVNNAGIVKDALLLRMKPEEWQDVLDVNLNSVFNTSKSILKNMLKYKAGKIINVSSVVGLIGNPGQVNYCASKAGIIGFTKSFAKEVAKKGIYVNCIAPGFVKTKMTNRIPENIKNKFTEQIPLGRVGLPSEIAEVALFLSSDMSNYVTGQTIAVDGGLAM